jgi:nitroreductase
MMMLLGAIDEGLGACFFGLPADCFDSYREAFDVPGAFKPIGAIAVGYPADTPEDLGSDRKPVDEVLHLGRWGRPLR